MYKKSSHLFARLENQSGYNDTHDNHITNPFVNNFNNANTQALARSLVSEAVQMKGIEMFYIRREFVNFDKLFGEDLQSKFKKAYRVAMYIESFDGFSGQQEFFSKFGMQVNDEMTLVVSPELFSIQADGEVVKEGDLIFFPMSKGLFEVIWVEPNAPFLQAGQVSQYKITAQKFVYSGEELKPEFDATDLLFDSQLDPIRMLDGRADTNIEEYSEDNAIAAEADTFVEEFDNLIGGGVHPVVFPVEPHKPSIPDSFDDLEAF